MSLGLKEQDYLLTLIRNMVGERELEESDFLKDPQWRTGRRTNYSKHMPKTPTFVSIK